MCEQLNYLKRFTLGMCCLQYTLTRITHSTATIINNIYVKGNTDIGIKSGIITYSISDHMQVFVCISKKKYTTIKKLLTFKCRKITDVNINYIAHELNIVN